MSLLQLATSALGASGSDTRRKESRRGEDRCCQTVCGKQRSKAEAGWHRLCCAAGDLLAETEELAGARIPAASYKITTSTTDSRKGLVQPAVSRAPDSRRSDREQSTQRSMPREQHRAAHTCAPRTRRAQNARLLPRASEHGDSHRAGSRGQRTVPILVAYLSAAEHMPVIILLEFHVSEEIWR